MTQRVIDISSPNFVVAEHIGNNCNWAEIFGNNNRLALEIGCGTGHFITARARQQPDINFVAIDIYNKGCWKTCKKIDALGLTNIRVARAEAVYLLEAGFRQHRLQAIYINCPDPWPKKRHRKRRLVNAAFLQMMLTRLAPGGDFFFSSDVADYARDVASLLESHFAFRNILGQPVVNDLPGYPISKYMQRFLDEGQPIYYLHHQRDPGVPDEYIRAALQQQPRRGFRSRWPMAHNE